MSDTKPGILSLTDVQTRCTINMLVRITVKGVPNIHKSRLQQLLISQLEEFDKERMALIEEHGEKDAEGKPIVVNNNYQLGANQAAFDAAFKALQAEFRIEVSTADPVKLKAVEWGNKLLTGDSCPELDATESLFLLDIVTAFENALKPVEPKAE